MWKLLIAGTAASVITGSSLLFAQQPPAPTATVLTGEEGDHDTGWQPSAEDDRDYGEGPSAEDDQDNGRHWQPSAEDISAFMDARIAALKAGLRLTPDQDKNWPAFESAVRDMAKTRADRWAMRRNEQPAADSVERLQRRAEALGAAAAVSKSSPM